MTASTVTLECTPNRTDKDMTMNRFERGRREYTALTGTAPEDTLAEDEQRSPQLYDAVVEGPFGGALAHAGLSRAVRELTTVAVLAAEGGAERQLASHTRAALHNGASASELLALAEHVAVYAGFPRALNALAVIDEV